MEENILPRHVAIICDGNRRWAKAHFLPSLEGHRRGGNALKDVSRHLRKRGVKTITAWFFSTENWNRSEEERNYLFKLIDDETKKSLKEAHEDKIKIVHIGRKDRLPEYLLATLAQAEQETKDYEKFVFNWAIDYGGRDEIVRAVNAVIASGNKQVSEEMLSSYLDTRGQDDPDMIVRTSGEHRLSGFLLYQMAYAELFFPPECLPDLTTKVMDRLLEEFAHRHRRFGK